MVKDTKERKKRRRMFKAKRVAPEVEKIEFQDRLNNLNNPFVIVGKVSKEFTNSKGYMKLWVDMQPVYTGGPKIIRSEVIGNISFLHRERIARAMLKIMGDGGFRHRMSDYLEEIAAVSLRNKQGNQDNIKIIIKRN